MKFKGISAAVAALSLAAMPTLAVAAPIATPLTAPAAETVDGDNALLGGGSGVVVAVLAAAAAIAGIVAAVSDGNDKGDAPTSP